jgi:hypothetical protein
MSNISNGSFQTLELKVMSLATILNIRRLRNVILAVELVGLSERKGFNDMKKLYQVETKKEHKMKKLLIKRKQTRTEGCEKTK